MNREFVLCSRAFCWLRLRQQEKGGLCSGLSLSTFHQFLLYCQLRGRDVSQRSGRSCERDRKRASGSSLRHSQIDAKEIAPQLCIPALDS